MLRGASAIRSTARLAASRSSRVHTVCISNIFDAYAFELTFFIYFYSLFDFTLTLPLRKVSKNPQDPSERSCYGSLY